jgi:NADPH2:quinone reductase
MRAIQVSAYGGYDQLQLVDIPVPTPTQGQVLVKMAAAAINPLDNLMRSGRATLGRSLPLIPGNEGAGIVASEGSDLPVGTRVMFRQAYHLPRGGTWQEYVLAPQDLVVPLPAHAQDLEAAALRTAYDAAYMALVYHGQFQAGQVIFAPAVGSSVGNAVIQLGRALGAERVITTAGSSAKAEQARTLGYRDVIDLTQESAREGIARITNGHGVDVVVDVLGGDITVQGLASLKPGGTLVLVGNSASSEVHLNIARDFISKGTRLIGHQTALVSQKMAREAFSVYFKLWEQGLITPIVACTFPLEQTREAQRFQVEERPFGKVLLTFD